MENRRVRYAHGRIAAPKLNLNAAAQALPCFGAGRLARILFRNFNCPEQSDRWKCSRIEVMNLIARTGHIDVHSYEGESAVMHAPVPSAELALHEPHI